MNTLQVNNYRF